MRNSGRLAVWAVLATMLGAQSVTPGPQVLTFHSGVDNSDQPYALYVPEGYVASQKYPLVISLHGAWSNHRLNLRRVFGKGNVLGETDAQASRYFPAFRGVKYLVASPLARGTMGFQGIAEQDVYDVLADLKRRFSIDEDRIYLTGLSMGGGGALWLGLTRGDLWAAIAPVCPAAPEAAKELAGNALGLPVHLFQGEIDPVVPASNTRQWHKELLDAGAKVEYKEYRDVRHNAWDYAYANGAIFDWFDRFRRDPYPLRVRHATRQYRYARAYWTKILQIVPGTLASIDAVFTAPNQLRVSTRNANAFAVTLEGHPQYRRGQPLRVQVNDLPVRVVAQPELIFANQGNRWAQVKTYALAADAKGPGREGPIAEAVAPAHIYVYGTMDAPAPDELQRRVADARNAADWSTQQGGKLLLTTRVVADKDLSAAERAESNLILFGNRRTNAVIASLANPPLILNASAADYGLLFVVPTINGHYALVSSGLPWWTGAEQADRPGWFFLPLQVRLLNSFKDYLLFRGSLVNVVQEGYFDDHWRVPAEARALLSSTGAVQF